MYARLLALLLIVGTIPNVYCQLKKLREYKRGVQFSFVPGISTNGITSGTFVNKYSFNLFGGVSAGNKILEVSIVSNLNLRNSTGIQFAGIANVVGSNAFINLTLAEEREAISDGFQSNFTGIQFSGFLNYVRNNMSGTQTAGVLNVNQGDFKGVQLAGIGNSNAGTSHGLQLAGLYNVSFESVGGFQISGLFNFTAEQLSGIQIALVNKSRRIKGKKSTPPTIERGLQIGLLNFCKKMDGWQIGLINFGDDIRGKQIGLINFFNPAGTKDRVRNGTPIGLLNFGSKGSHVRMHIDEIFLTNVEITTGNCLNCSYIIASEMPYDDTNQIFNQNALIFGYDHFKDTWGFGYGFQKVLYNKFVIMPSPFNRKRIIDYGIKFIHLNRNGKFDNTFNLVSRLNVDYAKRWRSHYILIGVSLNYFVYEMGHDYTVNSLMLPTGKVSNLQSKMWPGYTIGIQI